MCSDVYLLINRTLELAMLVFVLFYMMRYFSEYIVNMKKKKVRHYIYCCIIVYAAYFFLVVIGLLREVVVNIAFSCLDNAGSFSVY